MRELILVDDRVVKAKLTQVRANQIQKAVMSSWVACKMSASFDFALGYCAAIKDLADGNSDGLLRRSLFTDGDMLPWEVVEASWHRQNFGVGNDLPKLLAEAIRDSEGGSRDRSGNGPGTGA